MYPWLAIALAFIAFAQSSFGGISDTIVVNFRQNAETNFVPGIPPAFKTSRWSRCAETLTTITPGK